MGVMGLERGGAWWQGLLRAGRVSLGPTIARLVCVACVLRAVSPPVCCLLCVAASQHGATQADSSGGSLSVTPYEQGTIT
jgi:hypothetical protein